MSQSAAHRTGGRPIDDYALLADTGTAALVSRDGSIDWLCLPRFDSAACFTALLGTGEHGFWRLAPPEEPLAVHRRYRPGTLVLETEYETSGGAVRVIDCMPLRDDASPGEPDVVRVVEGVRGEVAVDLDLAIRFDYGSVVPRLRQEGQRLEAVGGPDAVGLTTPVEVHPGDRHVTARFTVRAGEHVPFVLTWFPSHEPAPDPVEAEAGVDRTTR